MTAPVVTSSSSQPMRNPLKKKRVLLVDTSLTKRDSRVEVMRTLGLEVDCAADFSEARSWWRADLYDLVLIDAKNEVGHRDKFLEEMRSATPPQKIAFLVGKPEYLADSPNTTEIQSVLMEGEQTTQQEARAVLSADVSGNSPQHWGILEASRRISAVRSASIARTQAMRALPAPPRDSEGRPSKPTATPTSLDDLLRKELR